MWVALAAVAVRIALLGLLARAHGGLGEALCHFDCGWYERIAIGGYGADTEWGDHGSLPNWVFFPLYPKILGLVAGSGTARVVGVWLSGVFLAGFVWVGAGYLRATRRVVAPWVWLGVAVLFPAGVFFTMLYSEALFAVLMAACLWARAAGRPWLAGLAAGAASATRPTGILLAPVLALDALRDWRGIRSLGPVVLAPMGLILYCVAQYVSVGDALAFSHQQALWHRHWVGPWATISGGVMAWDLGRLFGAASATWSALWALAGLGVAGWLVWRRRVAEGWILAACVLLPAATGLDSMPRFVGCNPVFLFALHDGLARWPRVGMGVCLVFGAGLIWTASAWMGGAAAAIF